jgi:stage II sporulation protein D
MDRILESGGQVCDRAGKPLMKLAPEEKLRIWWDSRGASDPTTEYRIQVGGAQSAAEAAALMKRLKELGEAPDRVKIPDADSWRVLTGHFPEAGKAEPVLQKLQDLGFDELWVATESRAGQPRKGRAFYAVTERYERLPLPLNGVWLKPAGELTTLQGKGRYRGKIEIFPNAQGRLTVVNTLDLETYLRGVVPKEMGAWEFPNLEALKAQAVAARTYAVANRGKREADGFDMGDTVADQVYGGRDGEQSLTDRAVQETEGLFATYDGKPILALFMANCGGHTTDVADVFGGDAPYLRAVPCYPAEPLTLPYASGIPVTSESLQPWLSWELLRLASVAIPVEWLSGARLAKPATRDDLAGPVELLQRRLALEVRPLRGKGISPSPWPGPSDSTGSWKARSAPRMRPTSCLIPCWRIAFWPPFSPSAGWSPLPPGAPRSPSPSARPSRPWGACGRNWSPSCRERAPSCWTGRCAASEGGRSPFPWQPPCCWWRRRRMAASG